MDRRIAGLIAVLGTMASLTLSPASLASDDCYQANAGDGELRFSGVADGSPFSGEFGEFDVTVCLSDGSLAGGEIRVIVATASASVGNSMGDRALKDEELFFVERFPEAVWTSERIAADGEGFLAQGRLNLRGISADQTVRLRMTDNGESMRLAGGADILRLDYRVGLGEFEDTEFIHNAVDLEFDLELRPADSE
ncbi:MAG: YceI family protein [Wenzhouxiangella sp.]|jgi:polyisoprenoid-binding protein YceI|nr:YceI family protein [Wenzhouxiangella sp.]